MTMVCKKVLDKKMFQRFIEAFRRRKGASATLFTKQTESKKCHARGMCGAVNLEQPFAVDAGINLCGG